MSSPEPWARRSDRVTDLPDLSAAPPPLDDAELETDQPRASAWFRTRARVIGWAREAPYQLGWLLRKLPIWAWYLVRDEVIGFARAAVWLYGWLHMADERRAIAQMENRDTKAKAKRDINKDNRLRLIIAGVLAACALAAHLAVWLWHSPEPLLLLPGPYGWLLLVEGLALLGLFEYLGHRQWDRDEPNRRPGPLTHGTSARSLRRDLVDALAANKIPDAAIVGLTVNNHGWHGTIETERKLPDDTIAAVERYVHAPMGSLLIRTDPRNAASHPFKLLINDPLAESDVPDVPPGALDIRQRQRLGRHLFGAPLRANLRQHIGLIGRSGSGKSSGLWILIDRISACSNARVELGIDLTHGPVLTVWRGIIHQRAFEPADALQQLERMVEIAQSRNAQLAALAESDAADLDENWKPTPSAPAMYVVIDEFHVLADNKKLLEQVKLLARIGRKACVFLVLATPGASKEDMGSTIIKAMIGLKILFACVQQDVTNFLGGQMLDLGWRPDKLAPAAASDGPGSSGDVRDAGKAYLWDGDHQEPEIVRIARLMPAECRERARIRTGTARVETVDGRTGETTVVQPGITPAAMPSALAFIVRVFAQHEGLAAVPTDWVLGADGCEWSGDSLARALRSMGVRPTQLGRSSHWSGNPRGYLRAEIEAAASSYD